MGTTIEWYDFDIYATASALIFSKLFFPGGDPFFATLASFGTFAVGFFARPFGGLVFGHLGDRIGRRVDAVDRDVARASISRRLVAVGRVL